MTKRRRVFDRTKGRCAYCGDRLTLNTYTIDHITPRAYGGSEDERNMVASCHQCNNSKKDLTVEEYRRKTQKGAPFFVEELEGSKLRGHSAVKWNVVAIEGVK